MTQRSKAELLLRLHGGPEVLVFPNAWDALSSRIAEAEGYPAVATTSAGCAAVLGYQDGQQIPRGEVVFLLAKIVNAVRVPVTADMEAGYDDVEQTALDLIAAGADCLFAPGVSDAETIRQLVREIDGPVNIPAVPGPPSIPELKDMGVARVSVGSGASCVAMGAFRSFARELRGHGTFGALSCGAMSSGAVPYAEAQSMLARRK
jgi:2-methylisocitrate lyase-like PEP mutase family enzyme